MRDRNPPLPAFPGAWLGWHCNGALRHVSRLISRCQVAWYFSQYSHRESRLEPLWQFRSIRNSRYGGRCLIADMMSAVFHLFVGIMMISTRTMTGITVMIASLHARFRTAASLCSGRPIECWIWGFDFCGVLVVKLNMHIHETASLIFLRTPCSFC